MATTVWIDRATHARLAEFKRRTGAGSMAEAIRNLLDGPQESAMSIYLRRKKAVDAACKQHGVVRLVAFGSRARGDATAESDLDVAMELPETADLLAFVEAQKAIEQAFACPIDVIDWPIHRPRLMQHIRQEGVELYAK